MTNLHIIPHSRLLIRHRQSRQLAAAHYSLPPALAARLGSAQLTRCPIEPDLLVNDLITCWIKIYVHTNKNNTTLCMCGCTPPCDAGLRGINRRQQVDGSIYTNNRNNKNTVITIDNMFSDKSSCEGYTKTADMQTSTTTTKTTN